MLSRAAAAIYWMERYLERADNTASAINAGLHLALDAAAVGDSPWWPVIRASGDELLFTSLSDDPKEGPALQFLTFDERNPNSLLSCMGKARDNARSIREALPSALWEEINTLYLFVRHAMNRRNRRGTTFDFYNRIKRHCLVIAGIAAAAMSRDEAWHFGRVGGQLERADKTSRLLDVKHFLLLPSVDRVEAADDNVQWAALLESVGALEMFRKRHRQMAHANVVDFLVLEREFPRSILHCLHEAEISLHALTGTPGASYSNAPERLLGSLRSGLSFRRLEDITRRGLHEFLDDVQIRLDEVNTAVSAEFFDSRVAADDFSQDAHTSQQ